jgi:outer membrane biogenesis lipoprotein LolB
MKRSRTITLTLLASATVLLTACGSDQATTRELYSSKEKCVEDWDRRMIAR